MNFPPLRTLLLIATATVLATLAPSVGAQISSLTLRTGSIPPETAALDLPEEPLPQRTVFATWQEPSESSSQSNPAAPSTRQPTPQQPLPPTRSLTPEERRRAAEIELVREEHQRIAGVVPNFNAVLVGDAPPLSPGQKMRASFRSAIDPYQFGLDLITSAYGQATDSHSSIDSRGFRHGYQQGWVGYGKRYGANFADQFDGTILGNGVFPILFRQDARYYRLGTGSFKKRLLYSASTTVRCKGDNGKWQPNISNLLGNIAAGGISNLYYPAADRGIGLTFEQGTVVTLEGTFGAFLIEFYPDFQKHVLHRTRAPGTSPLANPPVAQQSTPNPAP